MTFFAMLSKMSSPLNITLSFEHFFFWVYFEGVPSFEYKGIPFGSTAYYTPIFFCYLQFSQLKANCCPILQICRAFEIFFCVEKRFPEKLCQFTLFITSVGAISARSPNASYFQFIEILTLRVKVVSIFSLNFLCQAYSILYSLLYF